MTERIHPTKVGQRVKEPYGDTTGWVIGIFGDEVYVDWDDACPGIDEQVGNFQVDELEAIPYMRMPYEYFEEIEKAPEVVSVRREGRQRVFLFSTGVTKYGVVSARMYLLSLYTRVWA